MAISPQHPAVVLRSHYTHLRWMLVVALIAVVGLTAGLVLVATDDDSGFGGAAATRISAPALPGGLRYDGGPEEGSRGAVSPVAPPAGVRPDGGPEEGTASLTITARGATAVGSQSLRGGGSAQSIPEGRTGPR
jgi:hypothetical protein